jgi:N-acetylmuramoyl-L-alanine amidase
MREINNIVLHCTATSHEASVEAIQRYWREVMGWRSPGYHWLIKANGVAVQLWPIDKPSNGVKGHNHDSLHISYIGGVDKNLNAVDTRTGLQKQTMFELVKRYKEMFPHARVLGHRDFKGVTKECPSFDVADWCNCVGLVSTPILTNT